VKKVGQIVGRHQEDGSVQIGYRVIPSARGKGYCTEAVRALITHLFSSGVERVVAEVNTGNKPSIRVLEKLGLGIKNTRRSWLGLMESGWMG